MSTSLGRIRRTPASARRADRGLALAGIAIGVTAIGWPFRTGVMLNLDLVVFDRMNGRGTPVGALADVPRRSLVVEVLGALSGLVSGVVLLRLLMVAVIAVAFVGAARALRAHAWPIALGAALLFALNPFLLTRIGVGHLGLAIATALLPWAAPTLLHPSSAPRRTFLWLVAFGAAGYLAATVALPLVLIGLVADRGRRVIAVLAAVIVSQLPWLLPAVLTVAGSGPAATSRSFRPDLDTVERVLRLATGGGFWQAENQVGATGVGPTLVAVALIALAQVGQLLGRRAPERRLAVAGAIGLAAAVLPSLPFFDDVAARLTSFPPLAPWRESQRLLAPFVWWVIAAAAAGADAVIGARTGRRRARLDLLAGAALTVATATVVGSAWWGLGGRVSAGELPDGWRDLGRFGFDDGSVVALPWAQYYDVPLADGRRTHTPVPYLMVTDVLYSHDLGLEDGDGEGPDAREDEVARVLAGPADDLAPGLAEVGVRWIVIDTLAAPEDVERVAASPGIEAVSAADGVAVYRIVSWPGRTEDARGRPVELRRVTPWWYRIEGDDPFRWRRDATSGWWRGLHHVPVGEDAVLDVPSGGGHVLYLPALAALGGLVVTAGASVVVVVSMRRRGRGPVATVPDGAATVSREPEEGR